ncbi:MAG: hypothetical protein ACYTGB_03110 [Planctomycetota bacterium]|jgi:hypothetical protein
MRVMAFVSAAGLLLLAGCGPAAEEKPEMETKTLFSVEGGLTFKNHVKAVADPAGGGGQVFQTSDGNKKMTFVNGEGFFTVPAGHTGRILVRLYATAALNLKFAVVGEKKHRSYYRKVPETGKWFEVELPVADLKDKVAEGEKVKDVTVWLKPLEKGGKVPADAQLYCSGARFSTR